MFCRNCGKELIGSPEFCPGCGARPIRGTSFCSNCGAPTTPLTEVCVKCGVRVVGREEARLREMSWFERHLNWTMVLAWVGTYPICFIVWELAMLADPYISDDILSGIGFTIGLIVSIAVGQWVLRKKNRSMWWLLISPTIFFLLIGNKSPTKSQEVSNRIRT